MIRFQFPQGHPMQRVAYTPDSLAVVTAQPHTGVFVRDRFNGQTIRELPMTSVAAFTRLMVSECGYVVVVGGGRVFYFGEQEPGAFLTHNRVSEAVAVGDHARYVYLDRPQCHLFSVDLRPRRYDGNNSVTHIATSGTVIAMSPDGRGAVAVRQRGKPQLVELTTGQTVAELNFTLRRFAAAITGFAVFAPYAAAVALGDGESIAVFDLSEFDWATVPDKPRQLHPICQLDRPDPTAGGTVKDRKAERWLPPLAFTPDGRHFLTLGLRERVQLYDAKSGGVAEQWGWRMEDVTCLAVAPDGLTACAGGRRGRLTVWDLC